MEGSSNHCPPYFNGEGYGHWKKKMEHFLKGASPDMSVWRITFMPYKLPKMDEKTGFYKDEDMKMVSDNSKALYSIYCALSTEEYNRVMNFQTAHEVWKALEVTHEGTSQVKETKIGILVGEYEYFKMKPGENVKDMSTRFTNIVNQLEVLGKTYTMKEKVIKILRALRSEWRPKRMASQEAKDLNALTVEELIGNLLSHEAEILHDQGMEENAKRNVAFSATQEVKSKEGEKGGNTLEQQVSLLSRQLGEIMNNKKFFRPQRSEAPRLQCFKCNGEGHVKKDCPSLVKAQKFEVKKFDSKGRRPSNQDRAYRNKYKNKYERFVKRNQALLAGADFSDASIGSEDDETEEEDYAQVCLMAIEDNEVSVHPSISIDDVVNAYDDLSIKFQELQKNYNNLCDEYDLMLLEKVEKEMEIKELNAKIKTLEDTCGKQKEEAVGLTRDIENLTRGKENLEKLLGARKFKNERHGIGYNDEEASTSTHTHQT